MFLDKDLEFSNAQAVTTTALATNVIDTGPLYTGNTTRNLGVSELYVCISIDTTMTDSGSDATVAITLESDDSVAIDSATTHATLVTIPAVSVLGTLYAFRLPIADYQRYIGLRYTVANGPLTAGAFSAFITKDIDLYKSYASAVTTGI